MWIFLSIVIIAFYLYFVCSTTKYERTNGVSISQPHWCPTNVNCDEYMREKVRKSIRKYLKQVNYSESPFIVNEQFALEVLGFTDDMKSKDPIFDAEFVRVFRIEFRNVIPYVELAKRENRDLLYYIK